MVQSDWSEEVKSMLESLKWKYHGDDHAFLAEIDLFGILRGVEGGGLLHKAWGRRMDNAFIGFFSNIRSQLQNKVDCTLVKKILELFEIIVVLCVGKLHGGEGKDNAFVQKKDKAPTLEKHTSIVDEHSAEILIRQAFYVIFNEFEEADKNYRSFPGLDWGAWQRTKLRKV
jgi:hypothetical protein